MLPNKFNILGKTRSSASWNTRIPMIGPMGEPTNILYRPRKFSPKRIANLAAWYDLSNTSSYITATGVKLLGDLSGNSNVNVLAINGAANNYASSPDSPALSIVGDIDIASDQALVTWTPASNDIIVSKGSSIVPAQLEYMLQIATTGKLVLYWSTGAATLSATSSVAPTVSAYGRLSIRATLQVDNGAGGWTVTFYTGTTFGLWTQLGTPVTGVGVTSIQDSTNELAIDAFSGGASGTASGLTYRVQIRNGINGTIAFDSIFSSFTKLAPTGVESSSNAATVTINTSGDLGARICGARDLYQGTVANQPVLNVWSGINYGYLNGVSGNYFSTPNAAPLQITGGIDLRACISVATWSPAANGPLISMFGAAGNRAYRFELQTGTLRVIYTYDGTTQATPVSNSTTGLPVNTPIWVRFTHVAAGTWNFYYSSDGITWTGLGSGSPVGGNLFQSTAPLEIGQNSGLNFNGYLYRAQIYNGIAGTLAFDFNPASYVSGPTFTDSSSNAATITLNGGATIVQRTGLYFDGANDYMKAASWSMAQPETVYFVGKQVSWGSALTLFDGGTGTSMRLRQTSGGASPSIEILTSSLGPNTANLPIQTAGIVTAKFNGASSAIRVNRNTASAGDVGSTNGNGFTLGAQASPADWANLTVSEILIYNAAHDTATQDQIIAYLGAKWGITV